MPGIANDDASSIINAQVNATAYTGSATLFVSLHTADPGATGASEVTGGSYVRKAVDFTTSTGGAAASNNATIDFTGMPAVTVTHIGLWSAATAGTFDQSGALTSSVVVGAGNTLQFTSGSITYTITAI